MQGHFQLRKPETTDKATALQHAALQEACTALLASPPAYRLSHMHLLLGSGALTMSMISRLLSCVWLALPVSPDRHRQQSVVSKGEVEAQGTAE